MVRAEFTVRGRPWGCAEIGRRASCVWPLARARSWISRLVRRSNGHVQGKPAEYFRFWARSRSRPIYRNPPLDFAPGEIICPLVADTKPDGLAAGQQWGRSGGRHCPGSTSAWLPLHLNINPSY